MNLHDLATIISPRLPLELVLDILSHLPLHDIVRLVQDSSPYFDRLLLNHPFFNHRHVHVCLISDPLYSPVIQGQLIPGQPLPPMMGERVLYLPDMDKAQVHFTMMPLQLARFHCTKRQIEFTAGPLGVRNTGVIGVALILTHNNVILKRSLHAINPIRTPYFERSRGYFGGGMQFHHSAGLTRVTQCVISMDWFCC
ncbi:hypothetical protein BJV82DRAFT_611870 [Fennellomyces sp. T-0311]|nr:hypothetical protein BJV82DRAFT_611870 [Fennellomyces sp. T-0311]